MWNVYPKLQYHNKFRHYYESNDEWEYAIYKEIKAESEVKRIFDATI